MAGDGDEKIDLLRWILPALSGVVGLMLTYEMMRMPPMWVHAVVTLPIIILSCLLPLRPLKAWLVASQYRHNAREGVRES